MREGREGRGERGEGGGGRGREGEGGEGAAILHSLESNNFNSLSMGGGLSQQQEVSGGLPCGLKTDKHHVYTILLIIF